MSQIRPIKDLRNTNEIFELCRAKQEPILITTKGYGDLVVMSINTYAHLLEGDYRNHSIHVAIANDALMDKRLEAKACLSSLRRIPIE
ncbi:MAG: prevent-host-death protein [Niameybacter sp.]|uniref:hypothetical protein n=1 Tax=Niameybacter sp. TaxID=2033640 RepID=UPI002FCA1306